MKILKHYTNNKKFNNFILLIAIIINLFAISNVTFSQGRRDFSNYQQFQYKGTDTSSNITGDTALSKLDSLRRLPVDSTAKLKYFKYSPKYDHYVRFQSKTHPLILEDASSITTTAKFDSSGNYVVTKKFNNEDVKTPLLIPQEDYISRIFELNREKIFKDLTAEKFKGTSVDDLSKLFEKFTDITIPLPFKSETIFGPPTFNLKINGAIDITASYQKIKSDQSVVSVESNTQNNINFKQEVQVTAKGTVGDKLTIDADWNTQRVFDFENQLKIKYTGYADEVIQKIEAGNVSLETKSSLIQSTQALFGIKGEFKLGPLTLSTVVSQKKSKQETKDYTGGIAEQNFQINVYDYSDNHFFLDTLYKMSFLDVFNNTTGSLSTFTLNNRVLSDDELTFEVWVQTETSDQNKRYAVGYTQLYEEPVNGYSDSLKSQQQIPGLIFPGFFRKLKSSEYFIQPDAGFLSLKINVPDNYHVAVTYRTNEGKKFGTNSYQKPAPDTLILKMVKTANQSPDDTPLAWELKLKNIYRLPVSKVIEEGFKIDVNFSPTPGVFDPSISVNGQPRYLLEMLGLDRYTGKSKQPPPDRIFDYLSGLTINTETGDIIFPFLKPFYEQIRDTGADSSYIFSEIYNKRKTIAAQAPNATKYIIRGSAKGEAGITSTINLGFNVVVGSVKVMLGSQELIKDIDYSVDYSTGIVVIKNASALASKDLKISYETNDLFSLASKTLIGARADYKINDKTTLGFTFLNLRQETLNDKVRIGEEPTNNSMFGLDLNTEFKINPLTKLVNYLPGYNTKEESSLNLKGEIAFITPDANTKRSRIPQDNNESIAYIDDMEGAKKIVSLGTGYSQWTLSSLPVDSSIGINKDIRQSKRGRMKWYNIPNDVEVKKIYPQRDVQPGQDRITPFYISFDPNSRGTYNYNGKFDTIPNKTTNWNGIMRYLNTTSTDLLNENINFIEFNMRVENLNSIDMTNAQLIIDLGQISEDAIPNNVPDTEDKNTNGILEESEDIGLDYLTDAEELALYNSANGTNLILEQLPDPALDNNGPYGTINLDIINGTQGNRFYEGGNRPDAEDLNRNGTLDTYNTYFEYIISLDTTNNKRISGRGQEGWFQYRVPLSEFNKKVNDPSFTNIEYARVWIKGIGSEIRIALVDFNLVGNQWFKSDKNDTTFNVSVVSIEENPQIYMSPVPGDILRQTIRNTSGVNTKSNEQSLSIQVNNLYTGQRKMAIKDYRSQTLDIFNYKMMKLFVNGDPSFSYVNEYSYDAVMVIRFGTDSLNFYEYRAPIHPDVRPGQPWNSQNEVSIVFSDLTSIKISRDSATQVVDFPVPNGPPGSYYRVKGNPTLNAIREFELGVEKNKTGPNTAISGSVWFNEIRVLKINDDVGYAYTFNAGVKIADFANLSFNFSKVDPNFHSIDARAGSRITGQNWDISGTVNIHKFINNSIASVLGEEWKDFINFPLTFRHSENLNNPKYYPGTDIELEKASQEKYRQVMMKTNNKELAEMEAKNLEIEAQTLTIRNDFGFSGFGFKFPGNNYVLKNYINKFTINFSASLGSYRDITYQTKTDFAYNGSFNFNPEFGLSDKLNFKIGKLINLGEQFKDAKIYLFIPLIPFAPLYATNFTANLDFTRTRAEARQRKFEVDDPIARLFTASRGFNFNWKFIENWIIDLGGTYGVKIGSDLTSFETYNDSARTQKPESEVFKDIFFNDALINFGKDLDYNQTTSFNPKFNIPILTKFLDVNLTYNVTYGWRNPNTTTNVGYTVGYTNTINTSFNLKIRDIISLFESTEVTTPPPDKLIRKITNLRSGGNTNKTSISDDDKPGLKQILNLFRTFIPDNVNITFTENNSLSNAGVEGRPGFGNFWLDPFSKTAGPSRLYQLGLSSYPGKRVPNLVLSDLQNQVNNLTISAAITPIFPQSIRVNLSFKSNWGNNNSYQYISLENGDIGTPTSSSQSRNKGYSIFFPGNVDKLRFEGTSNPVTDVQSLSELFKKDISSFPFPNWNITISGLEKFPMFEQIATSVTLENSFTSEYNEATALDNRNTIVPVRQAVTQAFNPLIGVNITFKELLGGSFSATFKYNSSKSSTLIPSSNMIQTSDTKDWSLNANFSKSGFEIPLFGLSLKNDISFAMTISKNINNPTDYKFVPGVAIPDKLPGNGSSVFTINPSIQYSLSSKVQMQLFFKYIRSEPTQGTANFVPRTSNEGGLNVRISIQ